MAHTRSYAPTHWDTLRGLEPWAAFHDFGPKSLVSRMLDDAFGVRRPAARAASAPALDVAESDESYTVGIELAGVRKQDISIELHDGVLSVSGEKRSSRDDEKERGRWNERAYGSFRRSLALPTDADPERVEASFADGLLEIVVHKRAEAKPRTVAIEG